MAIQSDLRFTFTVGDEPFEVVEFTLHEGLSETFVLQVELTSANAAIDFGQMLDHNGLLTIWQGGQPVRYVHGTVSSFEQGDTGFRRRRYSAVIEPGLARLKLSSDRCIFQTLNVTEISSAVLKAHDPTLCHNLHVQTDIARALAGTSTLHARFETYDDSAWMRIVASLPAAGSYS